MILPITLSVSSISSLLLEKSSGCNVLVLSFLFHMDTTAKDQSILLAEWNGTFSYATKILGYFHLQKSSNANIKTAICR